MPALNGIKDWQIKNIRKAGSLLGDRAADQRLWHKVIKQQRRRYGKTCDSKCHQRMLTLADGKSCDNTCS